MNGKLMKMNAKFGYQQEICIIFFYCENIVFNVDDFFFVLWTIIYFICHLFVNLNIII